FADYTVENNITTYKNVIKLNIFCCKECRSEKGAWIAWLFITIVSAGLTTLFYFGAPWSNPNGMIILQIICVLGVIIFGPLTLGAFIYTIAKLIHPYDSVENTLIAHLNKRENSEGHVWLTKEIGDKLKPI
ncbi:MAG: hypothetical protein ACK5LP_09510, partial [Campylobacteraceae bacterium]